MATAVSLRADEKEWQSSLDLLLQRFSAHPANVVVQALRDNGGSSVGALQTLRRLPIPDAADTADAKDTNVLRSSKYSENSHVFHEQDGQDVRHGKSWILSSSMSADEDPQKSTSTDGFDMDKLPPMQSSTTIQKRQKPWIESTKAEAIFGFATLVNVILLSLDVEMSLSADERLSGSTTGLVLYILQSVCLVFFTSELYARWVHHCQADECGKFWSRPINLFDFLILVINIVDLWVMTPLLYTQELDRSDAKAVTALRIIQMLRLTRILRIIRISRELTLLTKGIVLSARSVIWVFGLLFLCMYIGSLLCATQLVMGRHDDDPLRQMFGSVGSSIYTHFKIITLESWPEVTDWACEVSGWWAFYFVAYITLTNMAIVNLLTGMIMEGVVQTGIKAKEQSGRSAEEAIAFVDIMQLLLSGVELDKEGEMTKAEFGRLIAMPVTAEVLSIYDISLDFAAGQLFEVLAENGRETLSTVEIVSGLLRLRGSRDSLHPVLVRCDVNEGRTQFRTSLKACEEAIKEQFATSLHRLHDSTTAKLSTIQATAQQTLQLANTQHAANTSTLHGQRRQQVKRHRRQIANLAQEAVKKVEALDESINQVEGELRSSLVRELELEMKLKYLHCTQAAQTEADLFARHGVSQATQTQASSPSPIPHVAALPGRSFQPMPVPAPQVSDGEVLLEIAQDIVKESDHRPDPREGDPDPMLDETPKKRASLSASDSTSGLVEMGEGHSVGCKPSSWIAAASSGEVCKAKGASSAAFMNSDFESLSSHATPSSWMTPKPKAKSRLGGASLSATLGGEIDWSLKDDPRW